MSNEIDSSDFSVCVVEYSFALFIPESRYLRGGVGHEFYGDSIIQASVRVLWGVCVSDSLWGCVKQH